MKTQSAGSVLKSAALFTVGQELTKKGISIVKKKWEDHKKKTEVTEEEVEDAERKAKLDAE